MGIRIHWHALVAPLVGAWIEILYRQILERFYWSLPLWERGLKFCDVEAIGYTTVSLPLWERGLKWQY